MNNEGFYIGWQTAAPRSVAGYVKKALLVLFPAALIVALLVASFQKKFSSSSFEYGTLTTVKGIYVNDPVPMLKVSSGKDIWGNISYITIPLVGYGKHGAETAIMEIEKQKNTSLAGKEISLRGTLLYGEGKTWMQVDNNDMPVVAIGDAVPSSSLPAKNELGNKTLYGEIIDPKCYFGVMKPGSGKVHRDCAIRCILGGIPPVLKVQNEKGEQEFYLLAGANGQKISAAVQDYVAEPVSIAARAVQQGDWIVLYVEDNGIKRVSKLQTVRPGLVAVNCGTGCCQ